MTEELYGYPQLRADGTSSDFPNMTYTNKASTGDNRARVSNELKGEGAETLLGMVAKEEAAWMIEVRSPAALYSKTHKSFETESETSIQWDSQKTGERLPVFIISQLVALKDVDLPSDILHPLWQLSSTVRIPAGAVLAQGNVLTAEPLVASILRFVPNDDLPNGVITVSEPDEHMRFTVSLAKDLYREIRTRRDVQLGALIAAMGKLDPEEHNPDESRVLRSISQRLADKGVEDWTQDGYDPAQAATNLEPFLIESEDAS